MTVHARCGFPQYWSERLLLICLNSKTRCVCVVCLQDILCSIDPVLPAALVKCLYLLVCLPAKIDNVEMEETFQEPLTKVDWLQRTVSFSFFVLCSYVCCCICFIQCFFFPPSGSAPALQTAGQCGATGENSGDAVPHYWPHVAVGSDKRWVEAPGIPCTKDGLGCGNQQHCPLLARWRNILICLLSGSRDLMNWLSKQGRRGCWEPDD